MQNLEPGRYYHIYNRGVNSCNIFKETTNYEHFLNLYEKYILPIADTFAWCLLSNHFHFLLRIKNEDEIGYYRNINFDKSKNFVKFQTTNDLSECKASDKVKKPNPSKHFSHLFNAYSRYFNIKYNRTGSLFERPFKRILIENESYLKYLVYYIHHNPVKHCFVEDMIEYPWSSYLSILSPKKTNLNRKQVIEWFDDLHNLEYFHEKEQDLNKIRHLI